MNSAMQKKNMQPHNAQTTAMLRVAIVEDSLNISHRLKDLVEAVPCASVVGQATTEISAIKLCRLDNPNVILLDMQLESGTGLGVLRAMRYSNANCKPHIIVLTNYPSPFMERAAFALGADYFMDKSREFHKLVPLLTRLTQT